MNSANWTVSPASPLKAMMVEGESWRVLSSDDLRIVAPRMAALEAAIMVKSAPVMPRRASLEERVSDAVSKLNKRLNLGELT